MTSSQKTISLLNEDGTLTEKLCFLLKEIFISFDYDKDNMLSREELRHYFSTLNGERVNALFSYYISFNSLYIYIF